MTRGSARTSAGVPSLILLAVVEHDDVVGDAHHHAHVVLDQQQRTAGFADFAEQRRQFLALARIEPGGRLVEAQQHRIGAHGARDLQPPLRAIGQRAGRIVGTRNQADVVAASARALSIARRSAAR